MPQVTHTLRDVGQSAADRVKGTVRLIAATQPSEAGGWLGDDSERAGQIDVVFDTAGVWKDRRTNELPVLASNVAGTNGAAEIVLPVNSYYEVKIWHPGRDKPEVITVQIPNDLNPPLRLGDYLITPPAALDPVHVHGASAVPFTPTGTLGSENVQDAIVEAAAESGGGGGGGAPSGPAGGELDGDYPDPTVKAGHGGGSHADTQAAAEATAAAELAGVLPALQTRDEKNVVNGYPGLDGAGFVVVGQIPATIAREADVVAALAANAAAHITDHGGLAGLADPDHPQYNMRILKTGFNRYYLGGSYGAQSNFVLVLNNLYLVPCEIGNPLTVAGIVSQVTVASSGGSGGVLRYGLYVADAEGKAGALLAGTEGTVSTETTGQKELAFAVPVTPSLHWIGIVAQVETCSVKAGAIGAGENKYIAMAQSNDGEACVQTLAGVSGALPNPSGVAANVATRAPLTKIKVA